MRPYQNADHREFDHAHWHNWYICLGCGAVVADWAIHRTVCHEHGDEPAAEQGLDLDGMVRVGRAEGNAVVESSFWRGGMRQLGTIFRLRKPAQEVP